MRARSWRRCARHNSSVHGSPAPAASRSFASEIGRCSRALSCSTRRAPSSQPRKLKIHQVLVKKRTRSEDDEEQKRQMQPLRQVFEETEQCRGDEKTEQARRRPRRPPQALPQDSKARAADVTLARFSLVTRAGGCLVPQGLHHSSGAARRSRLAPFTNTSGAGGRAL